MNWWQFPKMALFALSVFGLSGVTLGSMVFVPLGLSPVVAGALGAAVAFFVVNLGALHLLDRDHGGMPA